VGTRVSSRASRYGFSSSPFAGAPSGFTLLEVLIALLLLALGLVGSAAMQLVAMRVGQQGQLLSQASYVATTLAEHMRANASAARDPSATNPYLMFYDAASGAEPVPPAALCYGTPCDSAQLAQFELYQAQWQVWRLFPAGRLRICRDAHPAAGGRLRWDCDASVTAPLVIKLGWRGKLASGAPQAEDSVPALALTVGVR